MLIVTRNSNCRSTNAEQQNNTHRQPTSSRLMHSLRVPYLVWNRLLFRVVFTCREQNSLLSQTLRLVACKLVKVSNGIGNSLRRKRRTKRKKQQIIPPLNRVNRFWSCCDNGRRNLKKKKSCIFWIKKKESIAKFR